MDGPRQACPSANLPRGKSGELPESATGKSAELDTMRPCSLVGSSSTAKATMGQVTSGSAQLPYPVGQASAVPGLYKTGLATR